MVVQKGLSARRFTYKPILQAKKNFKKNDREANAFVAPLGIDQPQSRQGVYFDTF